MTEDEKTQLRTDVSAYFQPAQPGQELPLPAAAPRATMTPAQIETAFENWTEHINSRPAQTWTPEERAAIRVAATRALRTLGR